MIRVSLGSACVLGLENKRLDARPTTAYLLAGEGCTRDCAFCAQARSSTSQAGQLSRVTWPPYSLEDVAARIQRQYASGALKRACIQAVYNGQSKAEVREALAVIREASDIPVCVSSVVNTVAEARVLLESGADKVSIALDAATPELHRRHKGGGFNAHLALLKDVAKEFPGRVATHLIAGLGETERELVELMGDLVQHGVGLALFAFTPVRGTRLEAVEQPDLQSYRRVQLARYVLEEERFSQKAEAKFAFDENGSLISYGVTVNEVRQFLERTRCRAFETSGCPDCNRPYYNERPGQRLYNYPRPLADNELALEIETFTAMLRRFEGGEAVVAGE